MKMAKQVKFFDMENNENHGGILLDSGDVVCGECGSILPEDQKGETWRIVKEYHNWVNLDEEICGDDLAE